MPATFVVFADPFFIFHKKYAADIGFDGTDRYQNAGLINSFLADPAEQFDTIILGTSMSQNLPVSAFRNEPGKVALKLTLSGGRAKDVNTVARRAITTGRVKRVVWEISEYFAGDNANAINEESPLPQFLYNETLTDDWRYVFNNDVVEKAFKVVRAGVLRRQMAKRRNLYTLYTWEHEDQFRKFNERKNLAELHRKIHAAELPIQASPPPTIRTAFPNLRKNLLPVLNANPDIEFLLFFPPVSHYAYAEYGNRKFWRQMLMRKNLLEATRPLTNVRVFAFDLDVGTSETLQNYLDPDHYRPWISARMANAMSARDNVLTAEGWKSYTDALIEKVNAFAKNFLASAP